MLQILFFIYLYFSLIIVINSYVVSLTLVINHQISEFTLYSFIIYQLSHFFFNSYQLLNYLTLLLIIYIFFLVLSILRFFLFILFYFYVQTLFFCFIFNWLNHEFTPSNSPWQTKTVLKTIIIIKKKHIRRCTALNNAEALKNDKLHFKT